MASHDYTIDTPTDEPVEIRIAYRGRKDGRVLTAWRRETGIVGYHLTSTRGDIPEALTNLQATGTYPRKAVPGWQYEVIAYAGSGLGTITEIR